jgi:peptidoglycan/LPS O-acetylase OafA/YrhL
VTTPKYRPDIDGLRALAVALVVLFHSGVSVLPGGFIGVDVFFVISGFLITTIIYEEIRDTGFSYPDFYRRRIRRLMPALFAVILVSAIGGYLLLFPAELVAFAKSLIATVLSVSNVFFWREHGGYFANNAVEVPLLHTWSLAVEEQYYLVWPVIILICYRVAKSNGVAVGTLIVFVSSLALSESIARTSFSASYYLLPTRMFELAAGSFLSVIWDRVGVLSRYVKTPLGVSGLCLIGASACLLNEQSNFPGLNALYPTAGAMLLILSGRGEPTLVTRALSCKLPVFLGLISYSVYLWHWPLVVVTKLMGIPTSAGTTAALITGSFVLGWLSWRYIERPFRNSRPGEFKKTFLALYVIPAVGVFIVAVVFIAFRGFPERFSARVLAMTSAIEQKPAVLRAGCHSAVRDFQSRPSAICRFGAVNGSKGTALMLGDSHANHFVGFVGEIAKDAGVVATDYTMDTCMPVFGLRFGSTDYYADACERRNELARQYLSSRRFAFVILSANWPGGTDLSHVRRQENRIVSQSAWRDYFTLMLGKTLEAIGASGARPVLIEDGATPLGGAKCPVVRELFNRALNCDRRRSDVDRSRAFMTSVVASLQHKYPSLIVIDPTLVMCASDVCYSEVNGTPLYLDEDHLNFVGSQILGSEYLRRFGNPLRESLSRGVIDGEWGTAGGRPWQLSRAGI